MSINQTKREIIPQKFFLPIGCDQSTGHNLGGKRPAKGIFTIALRRAMQTGTSGKH